MLNIQYVLQRPPGSRPTGRRHNFRTRVALLAASVVALSAVSCSSTRTQGFRNPTAPAPVAVRQILVVAVDDRPSMRDAFEAQVVAGLQRHQVSASASGARFALADLKGDREQVRRKLAAASVETVLITRVAERSSGLERGGLGRPVAGGDFNWHDVSEARYQLYTSGGEARTNVRLESKLFRVADGAALWVGYTDTVLTENYDPDAILRAITQGIVSQIASDKLIP